MINLYAKTVRLTLALFLLGFVASAQVLNQNFISPVVLRQGETHHVRQASGGKLYVVGDYSQHGDRKIGSLVRLNADGTLDTSFNPQLPRGYVDDLEVLTSGKVVVVIIDGFTGDNTMVILNPDGSSHKTFEDSETSALAAAPDGGFYAAEGTSITRYSSTFTASGFPVFTDDVIHDVQLAGSTLVYSGEFNQVFNSADGQWHERGRLARSFTNGTLDLSFNANYSLFSVPFLYKIMVQPNGKVIPLNAYLPDVYSTRPIRLNADGSEDTGFKYPFASSQYIEEAAHVNGKLFITTRSRVARLQEDGSLDINYPVITYAEANPATTVLPDGSVIIGNYAPATYGFAKFDPNGQRVNAYYARLMRDGEIYTMDRTSNSIFIGGDFIRVGNHFTRNIARLNPDGTVLSKFKASVISPVKTVEALANSKVVYNTASTIQRLESDGTVDPSFSYWPFAGPEGISKIIVQPDGKILLGKGFRVYRINSNGSHDGSFTAQAGMYTTGPGHMDFDLDRTTGKILYSLYHYPDPEGTSVKELWRLNATGTKDLTFIPPDQGTAGYSAIQRVIALDNEESLIVSDQAIPHPYPRKNIVRLSSNGSIIEEFYANVPLSFGFNTVSRFGNRFVFATEYSPYSGETEYLALLLNGIQDQSFTIPARTVRIRNFYADNDTELFILGQFSANGRSYQIIKVNYNSTSDASRAGTEMATVSPRLKFYPNPVIDVMTIDLTAPANVTVFDHTGNVKAESKADLVNNTLSLSHLPAGRYVIVVESDGKRYREHIVKK
jgi:uncharacterized delta-60 repeat protein